MVILALQRTGRDLTTDRFIQGMESIHDYVDIFGHPPARLSATNLHASTQSSLAVNRNGNWVSAESTPMGY